MPVKDNVQIPADVPKKMHATYVKNVDMITQGSGRLMLFAGDQRVEHLNEDFFGEGIAKDDATPKHLFDIASRARIGAFAAQLGLIAKYVEDYPKIPYIVKLNSKTNLVETKQIDPLSMAWYSVDQVVAFAKQSGAIVAGVGYTLYLGSEFETQMLKEAAQIVLDAHKNGLVAIIWIYPRGKAVLNEKDPHLIAGACDVGAALGADFIKVNFPQAVDPYEAFTEATLAAGKSKVICAGGASSDVESFLLNLHKQIFISGACGNATGRNVHQKPLKDAVAFCNAISAITFDGASVKEAMQIYKQK